MTAGISVDEQGELIARPHNALRAVLAGLGLVLLVGAVIVDIRLTARTDSVGTTTFWLLFLPVLLVMSTLSLRMVREVRVGGGTVRFIERDGSATELPLGDVTGMGHRGGTFLGHLLNGPPAWGFAGRLVLLDAYGRQRAARVAGWFKLDDLAALCARSGLTWHGPVPPGIPVVPAPWPGTAASVPQPDLMALDDPLTSSGLLQLKHRRRRQLLAYLGVFVGGIVAGFAAGAGPDDSLLQGILGWTCGIGVLVGFCLLAAAPLNENRPRRFRAVLRKAPWEVVELVLLDGRGRDRSKRAVGVAVAGSAFPGVPESWWEVHAGGRGGWLQGDVRRWALIARTPSGTRAVVATLDRRHLGVLSCDRSDRATRKAAAAAYEEARYQQSAPPPGPAWPAPVGPPLGWDAPPLGVVATPGSARPGWAPPPGPGMLPPPPPH